MSNTLLVGQKFDDTQSLKSTNNAYQLNFDNGGTLVLWDRTMEPAREVWATPTGGTAPGGYAILQSDGNLVVYNNADQPVWNTALAGALQTTGVSLVLENSGKIVAYGVTPIFDSSTWMRPAPSPAPAQGASGSGVNIQQIAKTIEEAKEVITTVIALFG